MIREVGKVAAPLDAPGAALEPGTTVRVDVVVRTRKIGHFFPGGTVDAFDVWLELQAKDADGQVVFWSGKVDDGGKGPVEPGAHFYRSYQLDGEGNPINKRNAWQTRSVLYVRLIPPGRGRRGALPREDPEGRPGADHLHGEAELPQVLALLHAVRLRGPAEAGSGPVAAERRGTTAWSTPSTRRNIPANVSGKIKDRIPDLPIIMLAQATHAARRWDGDPSGRRVAAKQDRERWNDWGIGLLLQGDLKGAEYAFRKVTEAEPGYADGWLNVARALIQEGETEAAKPYHPRRRSSSIRSSAASTSSRR